MPVERAVVERFAAAVEAGSIESITALLADDGSNASSIVECCVGGPRYAVLLLTGSPHGARLPFKPGSVLAIELASWPQAGPGSLRWFLTLELLCHLGV